MALHIPEAYMGAARNQRARVAQVLAFGSIYQGAIWCIFLSHSHIMSLVACRAYMATPWAIQSWATVNRWAPASPWAT